MVEPQETSIVGEYELFDIARHLRALFPSLIYQQEVLYLNLSGVGFTQGWASHLTGVEGANFPLWPA